VVGVSTTAGSLTGSAVVSATVQSSIGIAKVEFLANGTSLGVTTTSPYSVTWDTTSVSDGTYDLTATATDVDGNVGTSPVDTVVVANTTPATTLSEIQTLVFTPKCSGCHNGSNAPGGALPGSQDLRAGHSFASLVNVASHEQPALMRVKPGDPANSYLIQKLEGAAGISGSQMPLGGPFLDQATIDKVKSWIASGAPNN
jgi:mono/diheme cytochrome c family protein